MKKKLNIFLLTEYYPPEPGAGSTRAYEHSKHWVELGHNVTVITCMPHYPTGIIPLKYRKKIIYKEKINGVSVVRTFTYAAASKGFVRRTFAYFTFMLSSIVQGLFYIKNADYIIATSPPFSIGISGLILSKLKSVPLVFEVRDMWPDSLIQLGQIKNILLISFLKYFEKKIYFQSKYIISVTDSFCSLIQKKGIPRNKIYVVKNGVDLSFFNLRERDNILIEKHHLAGKKIISYFGNFGLSQPIEQILYIAKFLINNIDIYFILIGDGERKKHVLELVNKLNLTNVLVLETVDKNELLRYYSISDIMVVPLQKIPLFKTVIPSKVFEIMAMGKPIIHNVDGETKEIVDEAKAGQYADLFDTEKFSNLLIDCLKDINFLKSCSVNGRKFVEEHFNRKKLAESYLKILYEFKNHS